MSKEPSEIDVVDIPASGLQIEVGLLANGTPTALYQHVMSRMTELGCDLLVDIASDETSCLLSVSRQGSTDPVPEMLRDIVLKVAPVLICCEVHGFDDGYRLSGRLMLGRADGAYLDAEDLEEDWDFQRFIDLEILEDMSFDYDPDALETPAP